VAPIFLSPNCFTPLTRTPWAGTEIGKTIKSGLIPDIEGQKIGESWEFSCDPDFPTKIAGDKNGRNLIDLIAADPKGILSPAIAEKCGDTCEILVKLINADSPLSLQVHPADGDQSLLEHECGKPESWLILNAQPGAGIYLGFNKSVSKQKLRATLLDGDSAKDILNFVLVKPGDFFDLKPGVPHAIGPGVTLLEPQRILSGKSGKTWRLWDWGRKYNKRGELDQQDGVSRELHIDDALRVIDPENQVGDAFVSTVRQMYSKKQIKAGMTLHEYPENQYYQVKHIFMEKSVTINLSSKSGFGIIVMLDGELNIKEKPIPKGQSVLIPWKDLPISGTAVTSCSFALISPPQIGLELS